MSGGTAPAVGDGLLVIDKPQEWTSHDVVGRCRRLCSTRRVGHAGTLDPMATGVLLLGVNRATKLLTYLVGRDKQYSAVIRLGQATDTDDADGRIISTAPVGPEHRDRLPAAVAELTGPIDQIPSAVSAIKIDGKRSYARVRAGEDVELPARPVTVHSFEVLAVDPGPEGTVDVSVEVAVSSGTYVRALARDLGAALGVGAHLTALRRTSVGEFGIDRALGLDQVAADGAAAHLIPMAVAAASMFPVRDLTEPEVTALRFGQRIGAVGGSGGGDEVTPADGGPVAGIGPDGDLVALLEANRTPDAQVRSLLVFPAV